jgi:hypothetical protein
MSRQGWGYHWSRCEGGGGGDGAAAAVGVIAAAVVIGAAGKAAPAAGRVLGEAVKIAAITVGCVLGAVVSAVVVWAAVRVRRVLRARRAAAVQVLSCPHCQGLAAPPRAIARHPVIPGAVVDDETARPAPARRR